MCTGDQVNRKGALTGGYHDQKTSRLEAIKIVKRAQGVLQQLTEAQATLQAKLDSTSSLWATLCAHGPLSDMRVPTAHVSGLQPRARRSHRPLPRRPSWRS